MLGGQGIEDLALGRVAFHAELLLADDDRAEIQVLGNLDAGFRQTRHLIRSEKEPYRILTGHRQSGLFASGCAARLKSIRLSRATCSPNRASPTGWRANDGYSNSGSLQNRAPLCRRKILELQRNFVWPLVLERNPFDGLMVRT
ncbi:MAG: hypothetical protein AABP62_22555 [Planctomycetota bacterium]